MESCTVNDEFDSIARRLRISPTSSESDDTHGSQVDILEDQDKKGEEPCKSISLPPMESLVASISDDYMEKSESIDDVNITFPPDKDVPNYFHQFDLECIKNKNRRTVALPRSLDIVSTISKAVPSTRYFKSGDVCESFDSTVLADSTNLVPHPYSQAIGKQVHSCPIKMRYNSNTLLNCTYLISKENCLESRWPKRIFAAHQTRLVLDGMPFDL